VNERPTDADNYKLKEQGNGIYRIVDPMGVGGNLIVGDEKALLIDTGFGLSDIRPAVRRATERPLIVMNSHVHTDHSGGNYLFDTVYIPYVELSKILDGTLDRDRDSLFRSWREVRPKLAQYMLEGVQLTEQLRKTRYLPLPEQFDLGGRTLTTAHLAGHTQDSSMVIDSKTHTAFVGDAVGPSVWLFLYPEGTIAEYADLLHAFSLRTDVEQLQLSHKSAPLPFAFVSYYEGFVRRASLEKSAPWPNNRFPVPVYLYTEPESPFGPLELYFCETNSGGRYSAKR